MPEPTYDVQHLPEPGHEHYVDENGVQQCNAPEHHVPTVASVLADVRAELLADSTYLGPAGGER